MSHYQYKCCQCGESFSSEEIESHLIYLCPECGSAEKEMPLTGVLKIEYDYQLLKKKWQREKFLKLPKGEIWEYPDFYPIEHNQDGKIIGLNSNLLSRIALNKNPLKHFKIDSRKISVFDDTANPTLSYKDRASQLVAIKAIQMGIKEISVASTGNAGSSMAGIAARLGLQSHIFVPKNIPLAKQLQIQSFGAKIYLVDGDYDQAFDLCLKISEEKKFYNRNTAYNPLTIEGKKSGAYDLFLAGKGEMPEVIFVPVGDGVIIAGIFKGLWELHKLGWIEKIPKLVAVQAEGSDALHRFLEEGKFEYQQAKTVADSLCAGAPRNLFLAAEAVKESGGWSMTVSDDEILSAQQAAAQKMGILSEPAAAASLAGWLKAIANGQISGEEKSLILLTGNGLKDATSLEKWNSAPEVKTVEEWKMFFKK